MKKYEKILFVSLVAILAFVLLFSCSTGAGGGGEHTPAARIGSKKIVSVGSQTLTMIYANDSANVTFPIGEDDTEEATLTRKFWMGETEVTNAMIADVLQCYSCKLEHAFYSVSDTLLQQSFGHVFIWKYYGDSCSDYGGIVFQGNHARSFSRGEKNDQGRSHNTQRDSLFSSPFV